ncbi:MAG TPA: beta-N-acetylhexosaminidase [Halothiobacillus sp.]|nr:beta-N-acetylhexosaminidase [Halothiobacillus sp.]
MALGPLMVDVAGFTLDQVEREYLQHPAVGGVILFARNYESPEQLAALVSEIHGLRSPRLLVAVDQEGGRVQRFREGLTRLPPMAAYGALFDRNRQRGLEAAREAGWLMAAELRALGIDLSFAPVLDLQRRISGVIGDRALHHEPDGVIALATAFIHGMRDAGMSAVGKHFPGHGSIAEDSHVTKPIDRRRYADIFMEDMRCFASMAERHIGGMMVAHVIYPDVDWRPASFSRRWISDILRGELGFNGAVFTDDLSMAAASVVGDYHARVMAALAAGCDMALICNHPDEAQKVLSQIQVQADPLREIRLGRMHGQGRALTLDELVSHPRWLRARERLAALADQEPELPI